LPSLLLEGLVVVTTALNLPGPAACARLRGLGARIEKVEPPAGDPFAGFHPTWYARLHEGIAVHRLDLKAEAGRAALHVLLESADLLVTAQRPSALARIGLGAQGLARHPRLCHVAITGHAAPDEEKPGHDLTYCAEAGLLTPPSIPATLYADMAGAERAVTTALALVIARDRGSAVRAALAPLADAALDLARPLAEGLTTPGGLLGGGYAGYNIYQAKRGWIAVAAIEPHFAARLASALGIDALSTDALAARFIERDADDWQRWASEHDLPIAALRSLPSNA
jgi:alpha-methylacyl-CoA racemase